MLDHHDLRTFREEHDVLEQPMVNRKPTEMAWFDGRETVLDVWRPPPMGTFFNILTDVLDELQLASGSFPGEIEVAVDAHHRQHVANHEALRHPHRSVHHERAIAGFGFVDPNHDHRLGQRLPDGQLLGAHDEFRQRRLFLALEVRANDSA